MGKTPLISAYMRKNKIAYFFKDVPKDSKILEIGSGEGWVKEYLKELGYRHYVGMDIVPPADIVANIKEWEKTELSAGSFDAIAAF